MVLAAGLTQFSGRVLRRARGLHCWMGRVYTYIIVFGSGPAALMLAFYANGGPGAIASFIMLSILWWSFTWLGWLLNI